MLDSAPRPPSARSNVAPFMVMDVVAAAARLEAAGQRVIHMEIGQPAAAAPSTAIAAARAALGSGRIGYTPSLGIASLRARIAGHYARRYGCDVDPGRDRRHDRLLGGVHARLPRHVRARRAHRRRQSRLSALSQRARRARLRGRADRDLRGDPLCARAAGSRRRPSRAAPRRGAGREPGQPDRRHDARGRRSPH